MESEKCQANMREYENIKLCQTHTHTEYKYDKENRRWMYSVAGSRFVFGLFMWEYSLYSIDTICFMWHKTLPLAKQKHSCWFPDPYRNGKPTQICAQFNNTTPGINPFNEGARGKRHS